MRVCFPLPLAACLLSSSLLPQTNAQTAKAGESPRPGMSARRVAARGTADAGEAGAGKAALPVTKVSLYKNGVGFFEHAARVSGDAAVTLELTSAQLNDALQTLTAVDLGGGRIAGANYNSTTPLMQQLGNLPFSLGANPSESDLYAALRGAEVEVTGSGPAFRGRILSLEARDGVEGDAGKTTALPERLLLTVVAENGGTRTLELTSATVVRVMDGGLRTDLNTYLRLLDRNRSEGIRRLVLTDRGVGSRELRVSFLSEVPVWKSTYRVLLTGGASGSSAAGSGVSSGMAKTATLQGYSVVDNTTGEDWNGVQLSLVAGSPQSFVQPLAQPIYDRRPEVPIAANAQMSPQTHDSGIGVGSASAALSSTVEGTPASLFGSPNGTGSGTGIGAGRGSGIGGGTYAVTGRMVNMIKDTGPPPPPMAMAMPNLSYEEEARGAIAPDTTTKTFDDFFSYTISEPVTIPRNGSALVPILQVQVPVESVTLWSPGDARPLRALWITNTSQLVLDRGSFSVVEDGGFAGEGLLDPVHPGERRLLSYAADDAVRVTPEQKGETRRVTTVSVNKGVLRAANEEVAEVRYTLSNAAPAGRTVVVEETRRPGWTLAAEPKPAETTPTVYRFRVEVAAGGSAKLEVSQRRVVDEFFQLANTNEEQLTVYLRDNHADPAVLGQLEPVFAAQRAVAGLDTQIRAKETQISTTEADGKRVRENLQVLKGSAEERALARRYTAELNAEEDQLASLRKELAGLQAQRETAEAALSQQIAGLRIGEEAVAPQ